MKLLQLIVEQLDNKPKVITMAGSAGSGKTHLLKQLQLDTLHHVNPDKYLEDLKSPHYGNLSAASKQVDQDIKHFTKNKQSFVWDTTSGDINEIKNLIHQGYNVFMVMVYTHPMLSFISNFSRSRKVPIVAVFNTWEKVYSLIDEYQNLLGNNFVLYNNDRDGKYEKQLHQFNIAAKKGGIGIENFLNDYIKKNGGEVHFKSTFSKPFSLPGNLKKQFTQNTQELNYDRSNEKLNKYLEKYWLEHYEKNNIGPDKQSLQKKLNSLQRQFERQNKSQIELYDKISKMIISKDFYQLLKPQSIQEINQRVQKFLT